MKKFKHLLFVLFPFIVFSQSWQQCSDSLLSNINKNNIGKSIYFINKADKEIDTKNIFKDTVYADYLYRKGVLKYRTNDFTPALFEESISIWNNSVQINYLKLIKNYYFLAEGYNIKKEYNNAYLNYEKCYILSKEKKLTNNIYFINSTYCLSVIDYKENFNYKKAEFYASEYIDLNKKVAFQNFDFNYAYAHRWKEDLKGYENVLLFFKKNYEETNTNNPELYFQINYLLFECYLKYVIYDNQEKFNEIIKYGQESLVIYNKLSVKNDKILKSIYSGLLNSYQELNDIENVKKYEKLIKNLSL